MQFQLILLKCMQKCPFYHHETCNETKYFFNRNMKELLALVSDCFGYVFSISKTH